MPICVPEFGLAIYTSPKVLSTSLKLWAFEIENGYAFRPFIVQGRKRYVHHLYPTNPYKALNLDRYPHVVCFVRDPYERFVSVYQDRVLRKHAAHEREWRRASNLGLPYTPTFEQFLKQLNRYRAVVPEVRHHSRLQSYFVGTHPRRFERVFTNRTVPAFEAYIAGISGQIIQLPWSKKTDSVRPHSVNNEHEPLIYRHYRRDYRLFGEYFTSGAK